MGTRPVWTDTVCVWARVGTTVKFRQDVMQEWMDGCKARIGRRTVGQKGRTAHSILSTELCLCEVEDKVTKVEVLWRLDDLLCLPRF